MFKNYRAIMSTTYSSNHALASAVQAFNTNQAVVRDRVLGENGTVLKHSNRELMLQILENNAVSKESFEQATEILNYLEQNSMLQTLTKGTPDSFLANILETLGQTTVKTREFGLVSWAPKLAHDYRKKEQARGISAQFEGSSRYIGSVREKVTIDFNLISSNYITNIGCFAVYGHDQNGNLVFYWAKNKDSMVSGAISGRVKSHRLDERHGNAKVTTLNYVKVL
jgi:hypothetical protein